MSYEWQIIRRAATQHGVSVGEIVQEYRPGPGGRGDAQVQRARQAAAVEFRARGWPLSRIGRVLGGRDHATVSYWLKKARTREAPAQAARPALRLIRGQAG